MMTIEKFEKHYGKQILRGASKDDVLSAIVQATTKKEMNALRMAVVDLKDSYTMGVWQTSYRSILGVK